MQSRIDEALALSEEVLSGLETERLPASSACLRCLRIARLINDLHSVEWLEYEAMGYPLEKNGYIENKAFEIGCEHGRETFSEDEKTRHGFFQLAKELEAKITSSGAAMNTLTTQGVSLSGDMVALAMRELSMNVSGRSTGLLKSIQTSAHNLSILNGQYYKYALQVNLELKFSQEAETVFTSYRVITDTKLIKYAPESLRKLTAAYDNLRSDNPESWSQALSSCRRVFQEISDALYVEYINTGEEERYITKTGKELSTSGANYKNRLYAVIDFICRSKTSRRLVGSEVLYLIDWVDSLHDLLNKGVHEIENPIEYEEARSGILHTYMPLGDIANLLS